MNASGKSTNKVVQMIRRIEYKYNPKGQSHDRALPDGSQNELYCSSAADGVRAGWAGSGHIACAGGFVRLAHRKRRISSTLLAVVLGE